MRQTRWLVPAIAATIQKISGRLRMQRRKGSRNDRQGCFDGWMQGATHVKWDLRLALNLH